MKIFAVLDVKAGFFNKPFCDSSTVQAIRSFDIAVNEGESNLKKFPDDFALVELADFDSQTGLVTPHTSPVNLGSARSVMRQRESASDPRQLEIAQ